eukprot:122407_1
MAWTRSPLSPPQCVHHIPKPSHHPYHNDTVIISTDFEEQNLTAGIYLYHLENYTLELETRYHVTCQPEKFEQFVHVAQKTLYLFGGPHSSCAKLHLDSKKMVSIMADSWNNIAQCGKYPKCLYVPPPIDRVYLWCYPLFARSTKMNADSFIFEEITHDTSKIMTYPKLVYNTRKQQIMIFGASSSDAILCYDIKDDETYHEWEGNDKLKMPYSTYDDHYDILVFGDIIFVFYFAPSSHTDIWCFDMFCDKWFKSTHVTPSNISSQWNVFVFQSSKHNVHLLDLKGELHFKTGLYELIPIELIDSRVKHYKPLIMGYIGQVEKGRSIVEYIPSEIKQLILHFFMLF